MFTRNTSVDYAILLLMSTGKRSFSGLSRVVQKGREYVSKLLFPAEFYFERMQKIAIETFAKRTKLIIAIDETLIKKIYSRYMQGSGWFFDQATMRSWNAYKLALAAVSDGNLMLPLECAFLFDKKLCTDPIMTREDFVICMIHAIRKMFPHKKLIFVLDGAFATKSYLKWCLNHNINTEVRMASNRVVTYQGKERVIREIVALRPKGRQNSRTIKVLWHGMQLYITAQRRFDKHGICSIVFQAATYRAKSSTHVQHYLVRWGIEKLIRTTKQSCGLQDCYSLKLETQLSHVAASLFAYTLIQLERKKRKFINPEAAIRSIKTMNFNFLNHHFSCILQTFPSLHC